MRQTDPLPPLIEEIASMCTKAVFEVDPHDPDILSLMQERAYLPAGDSLRNHLRPEVYTRLENFLVSRGFERIQMRGSSPQHFSRFKSWVLAALVGDMKENDFGISGSYGVDTRLHNTAKYGGKALGFLESFAFQLDLFEGLFIDENAGIIGSLDADPARLLNAWLAEDTATISASIQWQATVDPNGTYAVLDQRNLNWMPKIEAEIASGRTTMVVAGLAHMLRTGGLVMLLRNRGYSVERLPAAPSPVVAPSRKNTLVGSTITLNGKAMGTPTVDYLWHKDGFGLAANTPKLTISNVNTNDSGVYSVSLSNRDGFTYANISTLAVYSLADYQPFFLQSNKRQIAVWLFDRTNLTASVLMRDGASYSAGWQVVAARDFNKDQHVDLLLQHDQGHLAAWLMRGTTLVQAKLMKSPAASWRVTAVGDFNQDSNPDILFRGIDGHLAIWYMDGTTFVSAAVLNAGSPFALDARLVTAADFNGDSKPDWLWQTGSGPLSISIVEGAAVTKNHSIRNAMAPGGQAISAGDFNRDGKIDILIRTPGGQLKVWYMDGVSFKSEALMRGGQTIPAEWCAVRVQ